MNPERERPIGITRTLPYNAYSDVPELKSAYKRLMKSLRALNTDRRCAFLCWLRSATNSGSSLHLHYRYVYEELW